MNKYVIEYIGTFFLVLTVALTGEPIAIGIVLTALVYMGGYISGAHYNPAVTLAVFVRHKIEALPMLGYIAAQLLGGFTAALVFSAIKHQTFVPIPGTDVANPVVFLVELLFTFALASVVLHVATSVGTEDNDFYGIAIGGLLMAAAFAGGPVSGGVYNPAVAIGPMLVDVGNLSAHFAYLGIYTLAPLCGGILAGLLFNLLMGVKKER